MTTDLSEWECACCGRKGTLASRRSNATVYEKVTSITPTVVAASKVVGITGARFDGYCCHGCGSCVAHSADELVQLLGGDKS